MCHADAPAQEGEAEEPEEGGGAIEEEVEFRGEVGEVVEGYGEGKEGEGEKGDDE